MRQEAAILHVRKELVYKNVILMFSAILQALTMSEMYKEGKLLAYRLLVMTTVRPTDIPLPSEQLCRFYRVLHHGLVHADQVR